MTHLLELRVKINLSREKYQFVQGIYSGWQWLGIFEIGTIVLALIWLIRDRKANNIYRYLLIAFLCFGISLAIFFTFTFPTNQATANWTNLPANWEDLRKTWEYSHAARAVLYLFGFSFLIVSILIKEKNQL